MNQKEGTFLPSPIFCGCGCCWLVVEVNSEAPAVMTLMVAIGEVMIIRLFAGGYDGVEVWVWVMVLMCHRSPSGEDFLGRCACVGGLGGKYEGVGIDFCHLLVDGWWRGVG